MRGLQNFSEYFRGNRRGQKMPHVATFRDYSINGGDFSLRVAVRV
jgi:hypothetical protein